jgi:hypothetical protein
MSLLARPVRRAKNVVGKERAQRRQYQHALHIAPRRCEKFRLHNTDELPAKMPPILRAMACIVGTTSRLRYLTLSPKVITKIGRELVE